MRKNNKTPKKVYLVNARIRKGANDPETSVATNYKTTSAIVATTLFIKEFKPFVLLALFVMPIDEVEPADYLTYGWR